MRSDPTTFMRLNTNTAAKYFNPNVKVRLFKIEF